MLMLKLRLGFKEKRRTQIGKSSKHLKNGKVYFVCKGDEKRLFFNTGTSVRARSRHRCARKGSWGSGGAARQKTTKMRRRKKFVLSKKTPSAWSRYAVLKIEVKK